METITPSISPRPALLAFVALSTLAHALLLLSLAAPPVANKVYPAQQQGTLIITHYQPAPEKGAENDSSTIKAAQEAITPPQTNNILKREITDKPKVDKNIIEKKQPKLSRPLSSPLPPPLSSPLVAPELTRQPQHALTQLAPDSNKANGESTLTTNTTTSSEQHDFTADNNVSEVADSSAFKATVKPTVHRINDGFPTKLQPTSPTIGISTVQYDDLVQNIRQQLEKHIRYPLIAKKRGWQGRVTVGFYINKNGYVNNIYIAQSSGYSLLDKSALAAFNEILHIAFKTDDNIDPTNVLKVPIMYQLLEG